MLQSPIYFLRTKFIQIVEWIYFTRNDIKLRTLMILVEEALIQSSIKCRSWFLKGGLFTEDTKWNGYHAIPPQTFVNRFSNTLKVWFNQFLSVSCLFMTPDGSVAFLCWNVTTQGHKTWIDWNWHWTDANHSVQSDSLLMCHCCSAWLPPTDHLCTPQPPVVLEDNSVTPSQHWEGMFLLVFVDVMNVVKIRRLYKM